LGTWIFNDLKSSQTWAKFVSLSMHGIPYLWGGACVRRGGFKITTNAKACGTQFDPKDPCPIGLMFPKRSYNPTLCPKHNSLFTSANRQHPYN